MAHSHDHEHDQGSYYVEQLCTIGVCGALGAIAVMLYFNRPLIELLLHPSFHPLVLSGGIALLVLVAIRAYSVWSAAGRTAAPDVGHEHHDHDHDHDHGHAHGEETCAHEHSHSHSHGEDHSHAAHEGHDHGWAPWRYVVLLLPVVLFFLNLPNEGFANINQTPLDVELTGDAVADKGVDFKVGFLELERASFTPESRSLYEGKTVRLDGQFVAGYSDRSFTLQRYKMNCCAADAIPLNAVILLDPSVDALLPTGLQGKWVQVTGQVQFRERKDKPGVYVTAVLLRPTTDAPLTELVKTIKQPDTFFVF